MDITHLSDDEMFDRLIQLATVALDAMDGVRPEDSRQVESQDLGIKILFHALSIRLLSDQSVSIPRHASLQVYDFSSGIVIARAAFETYLTFHRVFIAPETEDEKEFEYCLWRLRGLVPLEGLEFQSDPGSDTYADHMAKLLEVRSRIKATKKFTSLSLGDQRAVLAKAKDPAPPRDYEGAGFAPEYFRRCYAYSSGYVHGDGHAALQIRTARSQEDQRQLFGLGLILVKFALAKLSLEVMECYPKVKEACMADHLSVSVAETFSTTAALLGDKKTREKALKALEELEEPK